MAFRVVVVMIVLALAVSACGQTGTQSETQTTTTSSETSGLDAWRDCVIDRASRVNEAAQAEIDEIEAEIEDLSEEVSSRSDEIHKISRAIRPIQQVFDSGTEILNDSGLPGTIEQAREDPDIAAALDAVEMGGNAVEAFASLSPEDLDRLVAVMDREESHRLQMLDLENQKQEALSDHREAQRKIEELMTDRDELMEQRIVIVRELNDALDNVQSGALDWSLCTESD